MALFEVRLAQTEDVKSIKSITLEAFKKYSEMSGASSLDALNETDDEIKYDIENTFIREFKSAIYKNNKSITRIKF